MDFLKGFDPGAVSRGRAYAHQGFVTSVAGDQRSGLMSVVRNEKGWDYFQEIDFTGERANGKCTCPVGYNCKHVVAVLISWQGQNAEQSERQPRVIDIVSSSRDESGLHGSREASAHGVGDARRLTSLPWNVTQWVQDANHLQFAPQETHQHEDTSASANIYPEKVKDRLLYVLRVDGAQLRASVWKGRLNAQGTHLNAKPKRYNVLQNIRQSIPLFIRPVDLELLSALVHGQVFEGQSHYYSGLSYGLPDNLSQSPWVGSELLEQLCDTGRCFVSGDLLGSDYTEISAEAASHPDTSEELPPDGGSIALRV